MLKLSFITFIMSVITFGLIVNQIDEQVQTSKVSSIKLTKNITKNNLRSSDKLINKENKLVNLAILEAIKNIKNNTQYEIKKIKIVNKLQKNVVINTSDVENLNFFSNKLSKNVDNIEKKQTITFIRLKKKIVIQSEKINQPKIEKQTKDEILFEESYLNINGSDPITLNKFKKINEIKEKNLVALLDDINYPKEQAIEMIAKKQINKNKIINVKKDRISTALAATEKSVVKIDYEDQEMDLTFYDYSNDEEKAAESQKSEVTKKIESLKKTAVGIQLMNKSKSNTEVKVNSSGTIASNPSFQPTKFDNLIAMAENMKKPNKNKTASVVSSNGGPIEPKKSGPIEPLENSFNKGFKRQKKYTSYGNISAFNMTTQNENKNIYAFDLIYNDDFNRNITSDSEGKISFKYQLNAKKASRRVSVNARGFIPTSIDMVLDNGDSSIAIPMFERTYISKLMNRQNLRGIGGFVFVELDSMTEDVELGVDSIFEKKIYLNKNLRSVSRDDSDFNYILFAGVEPGNHIISFKTFKNKITSKIIHVTEDEIYYDHNFYNKKEEDQFSLFEEGLLSSKTQMLDITREEISPINYDTNLSMLSFNTVKLKNITLPHATRNYYQLDHLREKIFIGRSNQKKIIIPSEAYTREVIASFNERTSDQDCIVQININKSVKSVSFNGLSNNRMMLPLLSVLDKDGSFYKTPSNETKRLFIMGREQGVLNIQIEYTDNSRDFLQSYCSESSYLVEQL